MVVVLFIAGDQLPFIPLVEVVGSGLSTSPLQIGATALKVGVVLLLTVIVTVVELAHCPELGVNVYVVVAVLFKAGDHVPVIPFVEVVGKGLKVSPLQIGDTVLKVGVVLLLTVIV